MSAIVNSILAVSERRRKDEHPPGPAADELVNKIVCRSNACQRDVMMSDLPTDLPARLAGCTIRLDALAGILNIVASSAPTYSRAESEASMTACN